MNGVAQALVIGAAVALGFVISDVVSFSTLTVSSDIVWSSVAVDAVIGFVVAFAVALSAGRFLE